VIYTLREAFNELIILRKEATMVFGLPAFLKRMFSPDGTKKKSVFSSEKEAYDFCVKVYQDTGGVTPELRRAYEQYQSALNDSPPARFAAAPSHAEAH